MSSKTNNSASNAHRIFVYTGQRSVPRDVTHVRVHPSVRVIPAEAFGWCEQLIWVELCEGLEEIGEKAFCGCDSLKRITIPSSVRVIGFGAFGLCYRLVEVELSKGLEEIGVRAFSGCKSLKRMTIPSSVRVIAARAFGWCHGLVKVELWKGLEEIGEEAFYKCKSLKGITIPSSIRVIGIGAFSLCYGLVKVELCEGLEEIGDKAFYKCKSLKGITIPSTVRVIGTAFLRCTSLRNIAIPPTCRVLEGVCGGASDLKEAFPFEDGSGTRSGPLCITSVTISGALKYRFDKLAIHHICYYQPRHPPNATLRHLKEAIGAATDSNATGTQQDCLGMTPLHILACSTNHDMDLYRLLIEKYPSNLITEDKWGYIPIIYAFWGNAPRKVVQFLIESHETYSPDHILDWGSMIVSLGEVNATDSIWNLMQQNHFPDQTINWEECAMKLARSQCASIETFQLLLWLSVANRLDALDVGKWQNKVEILISECPDDRNVREERAKLLYSNLAYCEQLKEATWLLELAVWKAKIDEGGDERYQCRINCGVQEILPNVFSFLLPTWESNP